MRRHFALFDSLRGLAVLAVIGFHVASLTGRLGEGAGGRVFEVLGGQAVIVFFVISGFLLYRPYVSARAAGRDMPSTRTFFHRRVFRIVPAYWVILTVLVIYPGVVGASSGDWWRYYGFLQLYSDETVLQGIPVAWTLCVEVTFYLMLPAWAWAVRRVSAGPGDEGWVRAELLPLAVVATGGYAIQLLASQTIVSRTVTNTLVGQFPWMALGMALAVASVVATRREKAGRAAPSWADLVARRSGAIWVVGVLALAGLAALVPAGGLAGLLAAVTSQRPLPEAVAHIVLSGVLAAAFVLPAVFGENAGGLPRRVLAFAPVAWIGMASYSIYLWHLTFAQLIALGESPFNFSGTGLNVLDHVETGSTAILFVLTVSAASLAAVATYYGIERPAMRRSHRDQAARGA